MSKGAVTIRAAEPQDAALLRDLRLEALAKHPVAFAADYEMTKAESVEAWDERIRHLLASLANGNLLVTLA